MSTLNLPLVRGEDEMYRTYRMLFTVGIIIVGMFLIVSKYAEYQNNCDFIPRLETFANEIDTPVNILPLKYHKSDIMAKSITLYNLNQKIIPVEQIILIGENRAAHYIPRALAHITNINKYGTSITFDLPAPVALMELVIDVGDSYNIQNTLITSQVEIRDIDNKIIWRNDKPLMGGVRYNYLQMRDSELADPTPNLFKKGMGSYNELNEYDLGDTLQKNTWS